MNRVLKIFEAEESTEIGLLLENNYGYPTIKTVTTLAIYSSVSKMSLDKDTDIKWHILVWYY